MRKVEWHFWTLAQYREEEKWLNEKTAQGMALVSALAVRYEFETCSPGEYTYKIILTDNMPGTAEREAFNQFLSESGIEEVGRYHRWAYFRKKNDGTPFEMFNTTAEELVHANKIKNLATIAMVMMAAALVMELVAFLHAPFIRAPLLIFVGCIFAFITKVYRDCVKLVKQLEQENRLFE